MRSRKKFLLRGGLGTSSLHELHNQKEEKVAITNDSELKKVKKRMSQLRNAIATFDYADFPSDILAEKRKDEWENELETLENEVEAYAHP